jgi:hypothetical protein
MQLFPWSLHILPHTTHFQVYNARRTRFDEHATDKKYLLDQCRKDSTQVFRHCIRRNLDITADFQNIAPPTYAGVSSFSSSRQTESKNNKKFFFLRGLRSLCLLPFYFQVIETHQVLPVPTVTSMTTALAKFLDNVVGGIRIRFRLMPGGIADGQEPG